MCHMNVKKIMSAHLCNATDLTKETLRDILKGRNRQDDKFSCGSCSKTFESICILHSHCARHSEGGSYFFDHVTGTAFPKYDSCCSYVQVNSEDIDKAPEPSDCIVAVSLDDGQQEEDDSTLCATDIHEEVPRSGIYNNNNRNSDIPTGDHVDDSILTKPISNKSQCLSESNNTHLQTDIIPESDSLAQADTMFALVTVRNLRRTNNGSISFEMNKKDAHLFDAAAAVLMTKVEQFGEELIMQGTEIQLKIPNHPITRDERSLLDKNDRHSVYQGNNLFATTSAEEKLCTSKVLQSDIIITDTDIAASGNVIETSIDVTNAMPDASSEKTDKDTYIDMVTHDYEDVNNKINETESEKTCEMQTKEKESEVGKQEAGRTDKVEKKEKQQMLPVTKSEASQTCNRPVRKRKVTSRFSDYIVAAAKVKKKKSRNEETDVSSDVEMKNDKSCEKADMTKLDSIENNLNTESFEDSNDTIKVSKNFGQSFESEDDNHNLAENFDLPYKDNNKKSQDNKHVNTTDHRLAKREHKQVAYKVQDDIQLNVKYTESDTEITDIDENEMNNDKLKYKNLIVKNDKEKQCKKTEMSRFRPITNQKRVGAKAPGRGELPMYKRKDIKCPTCGKIGTKAMVNYHRQIHSEEMPYTCEVCGKSFKTRACITAHKRQHGEKKFQCDQCPAAFFRNAYLVAHQRRHTGDQPFVCDLCGDKFKERYILQRHISNVHEGQRNHQCDICKEKFFRSDTRDSHRQRHFEPSLKCLYCSKMFKAELDKRKHELTHTGEKQYFCPLCKVGFSQLWPYYRHMEKKHNIDKDAAKKVRVKNSELVFLRNKNGGDTYKSKAIVVNVNNSDISAESIGESLFQAEMNKSVVAYNDGSIGDVGSKSTRYKGEESFDGIKSVQDSMDETSLPVYEDMDNGSSMYSRVTVEHQLYGTDTCVGTVRSVGSVVMGECLSDVSHVVTLDRQNMEGAAGSLVLEDGQIGEQRNIVILNDYVQTDLEEYTKQFSHTEI